MRESLIALLQSPDKENRMMALEMNKGLHLIDDILNQYKPFEKFMDLGVEDNIIENGLSITISKNKTSKLPNLPNQLKVFNCSYVQNVIIPPIPKTLLVLYCSHCGLKSLPQLPSKMVYISAQHNNLTTTENLPKSLNILHLRGNKISSIDYLPSDLEMLDLSDNLLTIKQKEEIKKQFPFAMV